MDHHIWSPSILLLDLSKPFRDFFRAGKITLDVEVGRIERGRGTAADESNLVALCSKVFGSCSGNIRPCAKDKQDVVVGHCSERGTSLQQDKLTTEKEKEVN